MGSVMAASGGVAGGAGWFIPTSIHPLCVAVESITKIRASKGTDFTHLTFTRAKYHDRNIK